MELTRKGWFCVAAFILAACLFAAVKALAVPVNMTQDQDLAGTGGAIAAVSLNAVNWTGWIYTANVASVVIDFEYTHGTGTATDVQMRCETDRVNTTPNDGGKDMHAIDIACAAGACTATSGTLTRVNAVAGNEEWSWMIYDIPAPWLNCAYWGTAAGADDAAALFVRGITP